MSLVLLLALSACTPKEPPADIGQPDTDPGDTIDSAELAPTTAITLDGPGMDAWTFEKLLEGSTNGDACAEIYISSGAGRARATVDGDRFRALVPLAEGANEVVAVCVWEPG